MTSKSLKQIYEQVFRKITREHPEIQGHDRGLLYKIIQIILEEEKSPTQEKTIETCQMLGINEYSYRNDDNRIIKDLVEAVFVDRQGPEKIKPVIDTFTSIGLTNIPINFSQSFKNEEEKMKWFVIAACILVGVSLCLQYLGYIKKQKAAQQQKSKAKPTTSPLPIPAALCLVVPSKIASTINTDSLSSNDVVYLIDNASYFLSTKLKVAQSNEERLELTNEDISPDSQKEVYIRVDISDGGRELIDKNIPYILKTNLPTNAEFIVKQLACLKNLSGLEVFNRV